MTAPPLWRHQSDAVAFLTERGGVGMLDMDMGVGKTRCAIEYCERMNFSRVLVLTPKVVIDHWQDDLGQFDPRAPRVANLSNGTAQKKAREIVYATSSPREPGFVVVNYQSAVTKTLATILLAMEFDALIVDESHRLKAPNGKQSKWVGLKLAPTIRHRILLTGTPMPHSPMDLFAQFRILDPSVYGYSYWKFRNRYGVMGGYNCKQVVSYQNVEELQAKMRAHSFHVNGDDVLDLPEALPPVRIGIELSTAERAAYKAVENEFEAQVLDGTITVSNALVKLLRLQQLTGGHAHIETDIGTVCRPIGSSKCDAMLDMLNEDVPTGTPVVVFFRFVDEIESVYKAARVQGYRPKILRGGVNELASWQAGEGDLLLTQIQCGSVGVNLSRAHHCFFYSLGYSLGEYLQACKRLHRPGQTHAVSYYHLVAKGTVDGQVHRALQARAKVIDFILSAVRGGG